MGGKGSGKLNAELVKLDGTQIDIHGNVTETDFFKFLDTPREQIMNLEKVLTAEQALQFKNHIVRMKIGTSAMIPMLCGAKQCPVKICPFHKLDNKYPASEPCPIEGNLIAVWTKSYVEDLGVNVESRSEMILVNKLVECDIIDYRANNGLSTDPDAWQLVKVDISDNGKFQSETTNAHPLLEIKERIQRIRKEVLESLAATRKEKYKRAAALKQRDGENIGTHFDNLKKALGAASARANKNTVEDIKEDVENDFEEADWEMND